MSAFKDLLLRFFTHKDFLPPPEEIPGTLFTPLHFVFSGLLLVLLIVTAIRLSKAKERTIRICFAVIWGTLVVLEITKIVWETCTGATVNFEWGGILPLYPCSIFMYAMPLAIFGRGKIRYMGCGYVCSLGLLGGAINFIYPANILNRYSCISFAGFHTFLYHGAIVFCAIVMLLSGYHSYKLAKKPLDLLLPAVPALCVSVVANGVNFSSVGSDYMFFKLSSFFFAPIGAALPVAASVLIVYAIYLLIHALPYLPYYLINRKKAKQIAK
ncbi:MAG: YwaF family protein [Clostridia bacterium]|nr:YwaF family protein [Clostridia bacterium]